MRDYKTNKKGEGEIMMEEDCSQRNCKFFEGLLEEFKTFNFIIPSMRKENQIKTIPEFVI